MSALPLSKPLVVYDGDCGFCRGWVDRWRARTGDCVDYAPYQEVAGRFADHTPGDFAKQAYLFDVDGRVYRGAAAVLRALSFVPRRSWMLWCYEHLPGTRWTCDTGYRLVAGNRRLVGTLTNVFWGDHSIPPSYGLVRAVFLRMLGIVYLIAFLSLGVQVLALIGEDGIMPAADYLDFVRERVGDDAYRRVPTLFWFHLSDDALVWMCWAGVAISVLLVAGVAPVLMTGALWVMYLSLVSVGSVFLQFQWDNLLLEAGLLAILFSPMRLFLRVDHTTPPSWIVLWLYRWLIFRLMILSGTVKLLSGDPNTWLDLTALDYHYWTQPLPHAGSWYAHHLPSWFHQCSLVLMFVIELVCPFFIFGSRRLRQVAACSFLLLMLAVAATGNYTYFNVLTGVLCIPLFDDQALRWLFRRRRVQPMVDRRSVRWIIARLCLHVPLAAVIMCVSTCVGQRRVDRPVEASKPVQELVRYAAPFRSINAYGLFARMTTARPEIIIEGSNDGRSWKAYEFHWKPGDIKRKPGWVQPHQPRVDWQMWFSAMGDYRHSRNRWVTNLMRRILDGSPEVLELFGANPFPDDPPRHLRATRYQYRFADPETQAETGAWWHRSDPVPYTPTMSGRARSPTP